jgi:hypothetical protein
MRAQTFHVLSARALAARALAACALGVAACQPASPRGPDAEPACNDVAINQDEPALPIAAAAAPIPSQLGGPIEPGVYDLESIIPRDGAAAPQEPLWESLRVRDTADGIVFEFAIVRGAPDNPAQRFNAILEERAPARLVHVCGATGGVPVSYAARSDELRLLLPAEGGVGQVEYSFARSAR